MKIVTHKNVVVLTEKLLWYDYLLLHTYTVYKNSVALYDICEKWFVSPKPSDAVWNPGQEMPRIHYSDF